MRRGHGLKMNGKRRHGRNVHLVLCHRRGADTLKLKKKKKKLLTDITTAPPAARYILQLLIASQRWIKFWIKGVGMKIQRWRR